jgi:hypothetical protein
VSLMSEAADVTNIQSQCCGKKMKHADAWRHFIKPITRQEASNSHYRNTKRCPHYTPEILRDTVKRFKLSHRRIIYMKTALN